MSIILDVSSLWLDEVPCAAVQCLAYGSTFSDSMMPHGTAYGVNKPYIIYLIKLMQKLESHFTQAMLCYHDISCAPV